MKNSAKKTKKQIAPIKHLVFQERVQVKTPKFRVADPLFTLAHLNRFDKPLAYSAN